MNCFPSALVDIDAADDTNARHTLHVDSLQLVFLLYNVAGSTCYGRDVCRKLKIEHDYDFTHSFYLLWFFAWNSRLVAIEHVLACWHGCDEGTTHAHFVIDNILSHRIVFLIFLSIVNFRTCKCVRVCVYVRTFIHPVCVNRCVVENCSFLHSINNIHLVSIHFCWNNDVDIKPTERKIGCL